MLSWSHWKTFIRGETVLALGQMDTSGSVPSFHEALSEELYTSTETLERDFRKHFWTKSVNTMIVLFQRKSSLRNSFDRFIF